ncbi:MAG: SDR family NAD(P)-dependent oxidoreductase [Pyrinomonadaceae bacterium]
MKIAIVTGGSNGIGKATALELAKRGIGVILTYNTYADRAHSVVEEIDGSGGKAIAMKLDLTDRSSFTVFEAELKKKIHDLSGRTTFDHLINNGGAGGPMAFDEMTEEYFDLIMNTNFKGPIFLTQKLVKHMENGGSIVNVTSSSKSQVFLGYSVYGSLKSAFSTWTRYIAKELAPRGIRVNAVSPGPTITNFGDGAFDRHPELIEPLAAQSVFGRLGSPEDIAKVVANLVSDDFGWVTAQDVEASGGHLL